MPRLSVATTRMLSAALTGAALAASAMLIPSHASTPAAIPTAANPVVIELYHSQGCSSCPPAEADLNAIAGRSDLIALSFAVTYWDRLGWKDTFAAPQFTDRQIAYARAGRGEVATPEFMINGYEAVIGADRRALHDSVARAAMTAPGASIAVEAGALRISPAGASAPATVWLVRYDPRTIDVPIGAGENAGRTLAQRNVVRELVRLGEWHGAAERFALPPARDPALATAVLVQRGAGGAIVAARRI